MEFIINRIQKEDFLKINEDDVMFITNPGRMGDEDGLTFIVKHDKDYTIYRLDGFMYRRNDCNISLDDVKKQFPKWHETWKSADKKNLKGKYHYLYMGFGNGLSVDNYVFDKFKPYLDKMVQEYLEGERDKDSLEYAAVFNVWKEAFLEMVNNE